MRRFTCFTRTKVQILTQTALAGLIVESQVAIERLEGFLGGFTRTKVLLYSHKSTGLLLQKYLLTGTKVQILTEYLVDLVEEAADEIDRKFC